MNDRSPMNCEEFEIVGLDFGREGSLNEEGRGRVLQHARECAKCAALQSSWSVARVELAALGADSRDVAVPLRVEARVLQQFRLKHQSRRDRRTIKAAMWALAAAAVIVFTLGVWNLHQWRLRSLATVAPQNSSHGTEPAISGVSVENAATEAPSETLSASNFPSNDSGDFTQIPGATFYGAEEGAVVRLGMQRASLAGFGLPVNEESAGDWIQVDVLVAGDGSPQAYRLPQ
jgi:anti-sigma factor RsiW